MRNTRKLMKNIYKMNSARLNVKHPTERVAQYLVDTNEGIIQILKDFKSFTIQYGEVTKKRTYPPYIEKLLGECQYFLCNKDAGFLLLSFLTLIEDQRKFVLEYIRNNGVRPL